MTEARATRLPVEEANAAAEKVGVPDYMAGLSIFRVLLNHPALAKAVHDLLATMLASLEIPLEDGISSWPPDGQPPSR